MTRNYALYFDAPRRDAERLVKRGLLVAILVLHLFLVGLLLRDNPALIQTSSSLILVELNALSHSAPSAAHKSADVATTSTAKSSGGLPAQTPHASSATHAPVAQGNIAADTGNDLANTLIGSANAVVANAHADGSASSSTAGHGGRFRPPAVARRWNPLYPWIAYQGSTEGVADVVVTIGADGSLLEAHIDRSSGSNALDAATLDAIRHYTFRPGTKDGDAVEAKAIVSIEWRIEPGIKVEVPVHVRDIHQTIDTSARLIPNLPVRD